MKTLTEFFGKNLRELEGQVDSLSSEAEKAANETLTTEGKTGEELTAALPEATRTALHAKLTELTKMEGEKLDWLLSALKLVKGKKGNLKRVLVQAPLEGEKTPSTGTAIDGKYFTVEFFADKAAPAPREDSFGGRDGKRGGKGGKRGDSRGPRSDRGAGGGERGDRPERGATSATPGATSPAIVLNGAATRGEVAVPGVARHERPARGPRPPREARAPREPRAPRVDTRPPLTEEQKAEKAAKHAEREAARAVKNSEFEAKYTAQLSSEPAYDGSTNRIKPRPPGSAPLPPATNAQSEESSQQA